MCKSGLQISGGGAWPAPPKPNPGYALGLKFRTASITAGSETGKTLWEWLDVLLLVSVVLVSLLSLSSVLALLLRLRADSSRYSGESRRHSRHSTQAGEAKQSRRFIRLTRHWLLILLSCAPPGITSAATAAFDLLHRCPDDLCFATYFVHFHWIFWTAEMSLLSLGIRSLVDPIIHLRSGQIPLLSQALHNAKLKVPQYPGNPEAVSDLFTIFQKTRDGSFKSEIVPCSVGSQSRSTSVL